MASAMIGVSAASSLTGVTLLLPVSLLARAAASVARRSSLSASVTAATLALRAMSNAAAQPIIPAPITRILIMTFCRRRNMNSRKAAGVCHFNNSGQQNRINQLQVFPELCRQPKLCNSAPKGYADEQAAPPRRCIIKRYPPDEIVFCTVSEQDCYGFQTG